MNLHSFLMRGAEERPRAFHSADRFDAILDMAAISVPCCITSTGWKRRISKKAPRSGHLNDVRQQLIDDRVGPHDQARRRGAVGGSRRAFLRLGGLASRARSGT